MPLHFASVGAPETQKQPFTHYSHKGDFETTTLSTTFRFAHDLESSKLEQGSSFNSFKTFPDPLDGMLHKNL